MVYDTPAALRAALEARLQNEARDRGLPLDRLRRLAVFERVLVRLDVAQPGTWVVKGGVALEIRWQERARTTRDLDLARREVAAQGEELRGVLIELLANDPDGDGFSFEVGPPSRLAADESGRSGWRYTIVSRLAGREFAAVRVDIVARADEITATERLPLPGALAFAGVPVRDVEVVAPAQVFAEKLHALTRSYGAENSRVRDLADLMLVIEDGLRPDASLLRIVRIVFDARASHPLPDDVPEPPGSWTQTYATIAADLDITARSVPDAIHVLRQYWRTVLAAERER